MTKEELWITFFNIIGWPMIQVVLAWLFLHFPARWFEVSRGDDVRVRCFYASYLRIGRWKGPMPDGANWLRKDMGKKKLPSIGRKEQIEFLRRESLRGVFAHLSMLFLGGVVFLYNPLWAYFVMMGVGAFLNIPCLLALHYNYLRTFRLIK